MTNCPIHGEFADDESFARHLRQFHPDIPPESVADSAFVARVNEIEGKKSGPKKAGEKLDKIPFPPPTPDKVLITETKPTPSSVTVPLPISQTLPEKELTPLILEYKWTGQCPTCRNSPETFILAAGDASKTVHWAIGWCLSCRKEVSRRKVTPL